jgi:putative nucleotidyltransferase with HDIG domain
MNGLLMLQEIRKLNDEQAIIITSAHNESEYMFGALKLGVDGYIIKPVDYTQLNQELYKIALRLQLSKQNEEYKLHLQKMVDEKTSDVSRMMLFQVENYEKTLLSMVEMIEERDTYTAGHSKRVAQYSKMIAQEMGYSEEDCTKLYQAGILHDVGKVATPDAVLLKPNALSKIEYALIQEHVEVSYKLLSHIPMFAELAIIVKAHHERYDGAGYPDGLSADEIEPLSRIMIVADAFDAMTTNRIYKGRKSVADALAELQALQSRQFHPEVVRSAVVALQNVVIDESISQLPITRLEQERFAYFYKDTVSDVYNNDYLELILVQNRFTLKYKYMYMFFIHGFSSYNKKSSWSHGNLFLKKFATFLDESTQNSLVFRVFGDDFVLMSQESIELEKIKLSIDAMVESEGVSYSVKSIDLTKTQITTSKQLENV